MLLAITQGLALEVASFGIRVLLFEPGRFRTNFGVDAPRVDYGEPYIGTPVQHIFDFLNKAPPAQGNPDTAALRMYEIITKDGHGRHGVGIGKNLVPTRGRCEQRYGEGW